MFITDASQVKFMVKIEETSGKTTEEESISQEGQTWNRCYVYKTTVNTNNNDIISDTCR